MEPVENIPVPLITPDHLHPDYVLLARADLLEILRAIGWSTDHPLVHDVAREMLKKYGGEGEG